MIKREEFRKQFNKENPDNKAVSAVSIPALASCFVLVNDIFVW